MAHQKLLIGMVGLLIAAAGGVFVLVMQGGEQQTIVTKDFVASVQEALNEDKVEGEKQERDAFEASLQIEELAVTPKPEPRLLSPAKQPTSASEPAPPPASLPVPSPVIESSPKPSPIATTSPAPAPVPPPSPTLPATSFPININTAGPKELQAITGIGPVLAQRVIDYRNANGLFYNIEEIKNVSGIGDVTFEKMKGEITVGNVVAPSPIPSSPIPAPALETDASTKININTAGLEALDRIPEVGPVIAQRIIDYRNQNGPFQTREDLKNVKGIGDTTFEKMKDEITI